MIKKTETLSIQQSRKLVLLSQRIPPGNQNGSSLDSTQYVIEHLGYIQIDTISVIQRAHHHVLWNRNPRYKISHLDDLMANKEIFEYWSHAAAYLLKNTKAIVTDTLNEMTSNGELLPIDVNGNIYYTLP